MRYDIQVANWKMSQSLRTDQGSSDKGQQR
jgi:hypothetical protein